MARRTAGDRYDSDKDLFADPEPSRSEAFNTSARSVRASRPRAEVPTHDESGVPLTKTAQAGLKRQQRQRSEAGKTGASVLKRRRWEASPEGQERSQNISQALGTSMSPAQVYHHHLGVTVSGPGHGDQQLPGMENPHRAPTPPRWEDLPPEQQERTHKALKRLAGTSVEKMSEDFGAQLDQAHVRALRAGHVRATTGEPVPFTKHFYDEHPADAPEPLDRPKQMMNQSAQELGIDPSIHHAVVAFNSPNVKFTQGPRGDRTSPNIEQAEAVVRQHKEGTEWKDVTSGVNRRGIVNQGRPANARRSANALEQVEAGVPLREVKNPPSASSPQGSSMWGPKVGPFVNSFDTTTPDYLVADVHTGGGGMLPHLGTAKPVRMDPDTGEAVRNASGSVQRVKSEREDVIGRVPHFHAAADYAARKAVASRGYGSSVRQMQAAQWGEEQIRRKEASPKLDVPSHEDAYPAHLVGKQFDPGPHQGKLF